MSCVLDAFALVALALDEPAAADVEAILRRGDSRISSVNLAESVDQLGRVHGHTINDLRTTLAPVLAEVVTVAPPDEAIAWRAADVRRRHYRRRASPLSLADCFAVATVRPGERLATADPDLARVARAEGIDVLALPDTVGRRP